MHQLCPFRYFKYNINDNIIFTNRGVAKRCSMIAIFPLQFSWERLVKTKDYELENKWKYCYCFTVDLLWFDLIFPRCFLRNHYEFVRCLLSGPYLQRWNNGSENHLEEVSFCRELSASPLFSSESSVDECKLQSPVLHYYLFAYRRRRCSFLTNFHWTWRALKLHYRSRFIGQIFCQMNKRTFLPLHFPSISVLSQTFHELITFFSYIVGKSDWNYGGRASSFELKQAAALVLSASSLMNIALPSIISIPAEWKHFGRHGWRPRAEWFPST